MPRKVVNIIGQRFGRLVVLENTNQKAHGSTVHKCVCDCGNIILVPNSYLTGGHTKSCGCLSRETHTTHGKSDTRLYSIFSSMKRRCYLQTDLAYKDYVGFFYLLWLGIVARLHRQFNNRPHRCKWQLWTNELPLDRKRRTTKKHTEKYCYILLWGNAHIVRLE